MTTLLRLAAAYALLAALFATVGILFCFALGLAETAVRNLWGLFAEYRRLTRRGGTR